MVRRKPTLLLKLTAFRRMGHFRTEPPDSPNNRRWMRVFTTMSLTHSDGYVMYNTWTGAIPGPDPDAIYPWGPGHEHFWYPFWDANLGRPIGPKAQQYQDRLMACLSANSLTAGLSITGVGKYPIRSRYLRLLPLFPIGETSGQAVYEPIDCSPTSTARSISRSRSFADVNGDGKVNILDLIQVANGLGTSAPDPNGDGAVNILDLVFVAQQFSQ